MNAVDQILSEAVKLPETDRAEIADRLMRSLDYDREEKEPEYDEAWAAEIEARSKDVEEGRVELIDSDQVFARLRKMVEEAKASRKLKRSLDHDRVEKDPGYGEAWAAEIEARSNALADGRAVVIDEHESWARIDAKIAQVRASKAAAGGRKS